MTKTALLQRYAAAKFAITMARTGDERTAALTTQYTLMDVESDFKARVRYESEKAALEVLAMYVEDIEGMLA